MSFAVSDIYVQELNGGKFYILDFESGKSLEARTPHEAVCAIRKYKMTHPKEDISVGFECRKGSIDAIMGELKDDKQFYRRYLPSQLGDFLEGKDKAFKRQVKRAMQGLSP